MADYKFLRASMKPIKIHEFSFNAMGSPCEIKLYAPHKQHAQKVAQCVIDDVKRLEFKYSRYKSESFLCRINKIAKNAEMIEVDEETAGLLNYANTCYELSDGLFDITSGVLRKAWDFKSPQPLFDKEGLIHELLNFVGWEWVYWKNPTLQFLKKGMEIDFGGIVKEYAADRSATLCLQAGIQNGLINLGGDIKIIGSHIPWRIGIQHPREKNKLLKTLVLTQGALASSGDYERYFIFNGVRYGHILNPKTGYPVKHLAAVSVVADLCVIAGSASTIAMLKEENGVAWLNELGLKYECYVG